MDPTPRPLFICGSLMSMPVLACILRNDATKKEEMTSMVRPARAKGYARYLRKNSDFPGIIAAETRSIVDGLLLTLENECDRRKLDAFEGDRGVSYKWVPVSVSMLDTGVGEIVEADMYLLTEARNTLSTKPFDLEKFERQSLESRVKCFEDMVLISDDGEED